MEANPGGLEVQVIAGMALEQKDVQRRNNNKI